MSDSLQIYGILTVRLLSLSMGFSMQEYWNWFLHSPPGDRLNPGIKPMSLTLQEDSLATGQQGNIYT